MTEKRFTHKKWYNERLLFDGEEPFAIVDVYIQAEAICDKLNELHEENEQLKQNKFICLDCEHSGYTEIGCLCEKKDHWTEYKTECEDYEELK